MLHPRMLVEVIGIGAGGYCNTKKNSWIRRWGCSDIIAAELIIRVWMNIRDR